MYTFFLGEGGVGKSSALSMLALDWAESTEQHHEHAQNFAFVFLILLKQVSDNKPLAEIILEQHEQLEDQDVTSNEIKSILHGKGGGPVLLLIDGYDEYKKGTNTELDRILKNGLDNCLVALTSRPGPFLNPFISDFDKHVKFTGLSRKNIAKYVKMFFNEEESTVANFLEQANDIEINPLLKVPVILCMACILFNESGQLPRNRTDMCKEIVRICISRSVLKTMGKTYDELVGFVDLDKLLGKLGQLAMVSLIADDTLTIYKVSE